MLGTEELKLMTELKPCPVCGSDELWVDEIAGAYVWVTCTHCDCEGPGGMNPKEAYALWNRRPEKMSKYSNVIVKDGGPFSLYCTACKRWVPNTANAEMKKEGVFAHSHFCVDGELLGDDGSIADTDWRKVEKDE